MKIVTDFGIQEVKPKKMFEYNGYNWCIVNKEYKYMNSEDKMLLLCVVEYTTGKTLPISISHKQTLKSIETQAKDLISNFINLGVKVDEEINKFEKINN